MYTYKLKPKNSRMSQDPQKLVPIQNRSESIGPNSYEIGSTHGRTPHDLFHMYWDQCSRVYLVLGPILVDLAKPGRSIHTWRRLWLKQLPTFIFWKYFIVHTQQRYSWLGPNLCSNNGNHTFVLVYEHTGNEFYVPPAMVCVLRVYRVIFAYRTLHPLY